MGTKNSKPQELPSDLAQLAKSLTQENRDENEATRLSRQAAAFFKPPQKTLLEKVLCCFGYESTKFKI